MSESTYLHAFGLAVKRYRAAAGLSQDTLANLCKLHRTYIGGVERGERNIGLLNVFAIAKALNISTGELFRTTESLLTQTQNEGFECTFAQKS